MKTTVGEAIDGPAGTAIQVLFEGPYPRPEWESCIRTWFITAPGQHAAWTHYLLQLIHLRHIPGTHKPYINVPGATHEITLQALNPDKRPVAYDTKTWGGLSPVNFNDQFELPDDEKAVEMIDLAAKAVVDGVLWAEPPLSGQKEPWHSALLKTAAHLRGEHHG